jgi:predicted Zn-dependent protease
VSGSRGEYFDGQSSFCHQVELELGSGELILRGTKTEKRYPYAQLRLSDALGSVNRSIYFTDGGKCEIRNDAFAAALQKALGRGHFFTQVHRFETSLKLAGLALLLTAVVVWGFIRFGIPALAEHVAAAIPPVVEIKIGEEAFEFLDNRFFTESVLPDERKAEIQALFVNLLAGLDEDERNYRLVFRYSEAFGANAMALPGGTVIVTDDFIDLIEQDEELIAVLAHEIGHVQCRHALRKILQDSSAGLLLAALTGDISTATSMAASLPTMLVDASFSRDMEREADDVAIRYMRKQGISLQHFAHILEALQIKATGSDGDGEDAKMLQYLSTHPATAERIERMKTSTEE